MATTNNGHVWVAATYLPLTPAEAKYAERRGIIRLGDQPDCDGKLGVRADVMEVSCAACKRTFEACSTTRCSAIATTEHLRGGPIGERKKRGPQPRQVGVTMYPATA